jgi:hypothetical protein
LVKTSDELEKHRHVLKVLEKEASFEEIEGDIKKVEETKEVKFTDAQLEEAFVELLGQEGIHHHLGIIIGRIKECGSRPSQKKETPGN